MGAKGLTQINVKSVDTHVENLNPSKISSIYLAFYIFKFLVPRTTPRQSLEQPLSSRPLR